MIEKSEVETIMQITARHVMNARLNAIKEEKSRLRRSIEAEIKDNLDPEWNHAMRRALEIVESDASPLHPVLTAEEVQEFTKQVAAKIARLVPNYNETI